MTEGLGNYAGTCGHYLWSTDPFPEGWIDQSCHDSFVKQHAYGVVYHCVSDNGHKLVIKSRRDNRFTVDRQGFQPRPYTEFYVGDSAQILVGSQKGKRALIRDIGWHTKKNKVFFFLDVDGKPRSRRYWEEDIAAVDAPPRPAP